MHRIPLPLTLAGSVLIYVGERALHDTWRLGVDAAGALLLLVAIVLALARVTRARDERRRAYRWIAAAYGLVDLGILLYASSTPELGWIADGKLRSILLVAWPGLFGLGLLPAIAMEQAVAQMVQTPTLEIWRVRLAARAASIVALGIVAFAGLNFTAATWNRKIDLSYFKTTRAGESTRSIVKNLTKPVRFILFFPPGNEVLEETRSYLQELAQQSPQVSIEVVDQALDPERARALKVRSNGYMAVQCDDKSETLRLDLDAEEARNTLRKLDAEVQQRLIKVIRPSRVAYFTTGHMERDYAPNPDDKRLAILDLKVILESQGFTVRRLGFGEGLGMRVPNDAAVVFVVGPLEPITPSERDSLRRYLAGGGRAFIALDPDHGVTEDDLLAPLGVQVSHTLVANERYIFRLEGQGETPFNLATTRVGVHPSVSTLEQNAGRMGLAFMGAGAVRKLPNAAADLTITPLVHAMPQSWEDKNGNGRLDGDEKRDNFELAMAIERPVPKTEDANATANTNTKAEAMRAIVVADADFAANGLVRNPGNAYFVLDGVRWLAGDEQNIGTVESEQDVPLVHRKDSDNLWFYGTSFLVPAVVLFGGLSYTRRINRSNRRRS